jgi:hypothetical protein
VLQAAYEATPCTRAEPWSICMYFDAVTPKAGISKGIDKQNMQLIYWTLLELDRISNEDYWFTAAACREHLIKQMPGGMSRFLSMVMRTFFGGAHDMARTGVVLEGMRILAKHRLSVADFKAHAEVQNAMGQSALKPCPSCRRVVTRGRMKGLPLRGECLVPWTNTSPEDACGRARLRDDRARGAQFLPAHARSRERACGVAFLITIIYKRHKKMQARATVRFNHN